MKGYKVFNSDWTCRGFQYEVGKTYEMEEKPIICERGFHFCKDLKDCFYYYPFREDTKIAEVEMLGDFDFDIDNYKHISKICTNKIKILREIHFEDLITTTVPKTGNYRTNCRFSELKAFIKKYCTIDDDICIKDSIEVMSISWEEPGTDYSRDILPIMDPCCSYTYIIRYLALIDVKEKK